MADLTTQLIMQMEGFISDARYDRNAWRVGYGSDTYVGTDGKVHKVTKNTTGITREQAAADLARRIPEFQQDGVIKLVGQQAWNQLSPETKAAVTSLAYNYGSLLELPSLRNAIQSGSATRIAEAIAARKNDNGGLNKRRRVAEAQLVTPLQPNVPPRRPDTVPQGASAVAAIESMLGTAAPVAASAYARPSGSLVANALQPTKAAATRPNAIAAALQAKTAQPVNATGTAIPMTSATARPVNPIVAALNPQPALPAVSPLVPTIKAREPWMPESMYLAAANTPPPVYPKAEMLPGSPRLQEAAAQLSKRAEMAQLGAALENYRPPTVAAPNAPRVTAEGLNVRPVTTLKIDPLTGNVIQPTATPRPVPNGPLPAMAGGMDEGTAQYTPRLEGSDVRVTTRPPITPAGYTTGMTAEGVNWLPKAVAIPKSTVAAVTPTGPNGRGKPQLAATTAKDPWLNQTSLDAAVARVKAAKAIPTAVPNGTMTKIAEVAPYNPAIPKGPEGRRPPPPFEPYTGPMPTNTPTAQPTKVAGSTWMTPFNYTDPGWKDPSRLKPSGPVMTDPLVEAGASAGVKVAASPPLPRARPNNVPTITTAAAPIVTLAAPKKSLQPTGYAGLPASELPPGAGANPTNALFGAVYSPESQLLGAMNRGERPLLKALATMFAGSGQPSGVATALSTKPSGNPYITNADGSRHYYNTDDGLDAVRASFSYKPTTTSSTKAKK